MMYSPTKGLLWLTAPVAYTINMMIGALFFVKPIRSKNYVTLMDPFQNKYGNRVAAIIFIPCILADIMWVACILGVLGGTVSVVMDISSTPAVVVSAAVAIVYTLMGGLYSVAYTDVIQLSFMFFGLWFCVPFILVSPTSANATVATVTESPREVWIGKLETEDVGRWIDELLLLGIGGICYQAFYQRVLSTATDTQAKLTCYAAAILCPILAIPSAIIGAFAASTNWNQTSFGSPSPYEQGKAGIILPIVLQHLCPVYVSMIGVGALAAAVMSSVDSALLSVSSQLGRNVFKNVIYKQASEKAIILAVKVSILVCGVLSTGLAVSTDYVYYLWIVSSDMLYSMMVPQVICVFYLQERVNRFGACFGCGSALLLRILVGEPMIGLPNLLHLPWDKILEDGQRQHLFPFRTVLMLVTIVNILLASRISACLCDKRPTRGAAHCQDVYHMEPLGPVVKEENKLNAELELEESNRGEFCDIDFDCSWFDN